MISLATPTPSTLLNRFKEAIDKGHVVTWKYYSDGDFTHTPTQWAEKAYMRPIVEGGKLKFNIVKAGALNVTTPVYAVFHGRLIESFMEHFDQNFTDAYGSALPVAGDVVA
jgi:hypothetical protein